MGVYKHKNGKWYCRGRIKGERYHLPCHGAEDASQAKAIEDGIRYQIRLRQEGLKKENVTYTFSFLMKCYIESARANNKSSYEAEKYARKLITYFGKNKSIAKIKPLDVEQFKLKMLSEGYSNSTVNRYFSGLKRAYNILIENELIDYNPTNKVKKLEENNRRYRYLTKDEWQLLQDYLPEHTLNIVTVALNTGFRKRNVLDLKWEQIDFNLRTIELLKQNTKGKRKLVIPMTDSLYKLLKSLNPQNEGYVFVNPETEKPYTDIKKSWKLALEKAGIKDFHFHDLRRTVGTWLLEEGVDIRTIQTILSHADISTTERYLVPTVKQSAKAMEVLDSYMK